MKVTESRLDTLIDNLNTLICEDSLLTRMERGDLVRAVAAIGAMKARVVHAKAVSTPISKPEEETKERTLDLRFPHAGDAWRDENGV